MKRIILIVLLSACGPVTVAESDGGHPAKLGEACSVDSDCGSELRCVNSACQVR